MAVLRLAAGGGRAAAAGVGGEPQAGAAAPARGQSTVFAAAEICGDHRLPSAASCLSESGRRAGVERHQPALDRRHHLHSPADGVRLSGGGVGRLLAAGDRLGAGADAGGRTDASGAAQGAGAAVAGGRVGASFRSRCAVRLRRLHRSAEAVRHRDQHESEGEPLGQRGV
jgi:hypothetical protein